MINHRYEQGYRGCSYVSEDGEKCGMREKHTIHKLKNPPMYQAGEVVGRYTVNARGMFIKNK